jgi:hypothetical protein
MPKHYGKPMKKKKPAKKPAPKKPAKKPAKKKKKKKMKRKKKAISKLPVGYDAPPGSARERAMRRAAQLYKSGNKQAAFRLRGS